MNSKRLVYSPLLALAIFVGGITGCSMMKPPAAEEYAETTESTGQKTEAHVQAKYTHQQVIDAISATLTSRQFRFTLKRTDVAKAEVETQWRDEEAFEGSQSGAQGSEDKYRSYVIVSYSFRKDRINIQRQAQYMDFTINQWRDIEPRRYHREEDMTIQKVIMERLEQGTAQ